MLAEFGTIALAVQIAMAIAAAALILTAKRPKAVPLDDALKSTATRGAYVPLIIGRTRVGPIFAWVDDATPSPGFADSVLGSQPGFGKGTGGPPAPLTYQENSLHILCVGPGSKLIAIYQNGVTIWSGPITPSTHPSGSQITVDSAGIAEGVFEIHWGFPDDPILTALENSERHGLGVHYAYAMKILWLPKNLGGSRNWPRLEYEIECPCYSQIASTASELPIEGDDAHPTWDDAGYTAPSPLAEDDPVRLHIFACTLDSGRPTIWVAEIGNVNNTLSLTPLLRQFSQGSICKIYVWNNTLQAATVAGGSQPFPGIHITPGAINLPTGSWRYFWVKDSYIHSSTILTQALGALNSNTQLAITLGPEITGNYIYNEDLSAPPVPTYPGSLGGWNAASLLAAIEPIDTEGTDGVNCVHIMDQLLFAKKPYGAGRDRTKFDPRSIESCALVLQNEKIRGGITIQDGEGLESVLATVMQDCGIFMPWDPAVGKFLFLAIRYDAPENATDLPAEMILQSPEMVSAQGPQPADTLAFTYKDRRRNYREETLVVMEDGQISLYDTQKARKIPIDITTDGNSAARLIPRRQQEVLANLSGLTFETNHATQMAIAGKRISANSTEGTGLLFRIISVKRDIDSGKVVLDTLLDTYDPSPSFPEESGFLDEPSSSPLPARQPDAAQVEDDFDAVEVVKMLANGQIAFVFPWTRSSSKSLKAAVWGSADGISYSVVGIVPPTLGGFLAVDLPATAPAQDLGSYAVTPSGIDFDLTEDLSLDLTAWRSGRQLLLIGGEIISLQKSSGDNLVGLIRGRCGTQQVAHASGTPFAIVLAHTVQPLTSPLFVPGRTIHYKLQAIQTSKLSDLSAAAPRTAIVQALAFTPVAPSAVRLEGFRGDYDAAGDITILWQWHSEDLPFTGLGTQAFGQATGISSPRGHFVITILDNLGAELSSLTTPVPELELTVSDRSTLGLDALPFWSVEVRQVEGSFTSLPGTLSLVPA